MIASTSSPDLSITPLPAAPGLLRRLLAMQLLNDDRWHAVPDDARAALTAETNDDSLLAALTERGLLTPYQFARLRTGEYHNLLLGNYRILDRIGSGGMGVVFRAEQVKLGHVVAIKALYLTAEHNRRALDRFFREVQVVTKLQHPNIVRALDAGEQSGAGPQGGPVPYLVMEYVEGVNLEDLVLRNGPLPAAQACMIAYQIADALTEAHAQDVVHRDIKPGNIILAADGAAKLLDFGIARLPGPEDRITQQGAQLGTLGFMAPEQVRNPRDVDARADVFGLGATLFFMLTGRDPFDPPAGSAGVQQPPSARAFRADVSPALDAVLNHLMALAPTARTPTADAAMRELLPFVGSLLHGEARAAPSDSTLKSARNATLNLTAAQRILVVDDQPDIRRVCRIALAGGAVAVDEAGTGPEAVASLEERDYDLILLDVDLPGLTGDQVLRKIRYAQREPFQKVIMFSGRTSGDDLARLLQGGADDFLTKPFSIVQLRARVAAALQLKTAQDRAVRLNEHLMTLNAELEKNVSHRDGELLHARGAMVLGLARLVEHRSSETGAHLLRLQKYCRVLAEAAARTPGYARRIDGIFIQTLEDAAPLHDIGKVALPDDILNKPGRLTDGERRRMERHTLDGAETLTEVARRYRFATGFLQMAIDIARSHHERWDGAGYPDGLAGESIPLAARLLAVCDVYDALRSKRIYKPALSHNLAMTTMCEGSPGHFDPGLLAVLRQCGTRFDAIHAEHSD